MDKLFALVAWAVWLVFFALPMAGVVLLLGCLYGFVFVLVALARVVQCVEGRIDRLCARLWLGW